MQPSITSSQTIPVSLPVRPYPRAFSPQIEPMSLPIKPYPQCYLLSSYTPLPSPLRLNSVSPPTRPHPSIISPQTEPSVTIISYQTMPQCHLPSNCSLVFPHFKLHTSVYTLIPHLLRTYPSVISSQTASMSLLLRPYPSLTSPQTALLPPLHRAITDIFRSLKISGIPSPLVILSLNGRAR